jgi:uncharacterized membrane protein
MKKHLRTTLLAGVFAAIPVAVTAFILWYVETQTRQLFRVRTPFVGVLLAIVLIYLLGLLVTSLLGKWLLGVLDKLLRKVPGLSELYSTWKQVLGTPGHSQGIFTRVVMIPSEAGEVMGFTSGEAVGPGSQVACVFVPRTPNPAVGDLVFVPMGKMRFVEVEMEEAFKFVLSGGNYVPEGMAARDA